MKNIVVAEIDCVRIFKIVLFIHLFLIVWVFLVVLRPLFIVVAFVVEHRLSIYGVQG